MEVDTCDKEVYKCTYEGCTAIYNKQSKLETHLKKHTIERPFQCDVCKKTFRNKSHLSKHKRNIHKKNIEPIRCKYEGCGIVLSNNYSYKRHITRCHDSKEFSYVCEVCKVEFNKKTQLNVHMSEHTGVSPFKCETCGLTFESKTQYRKHRKAEKDVKRYSCTHEGCNAKFRRPSKLEVHIRKHTGVRPFKCDDCDKTYTNESHYRRHKNTAHLKKSVDPIRCPFEGCYKYLGNKYSYKRHLNRYHDFNKKFPYNCGTCNKGFHKKSQLNNHMYEHTGSTPFKCDSCKIIFTNITAYKKHKSNHKTYECVCKEVFDRWTKLLQHRKVCQECVKVYDCKDCNKVFGSKQNLKDHLKVHNTDPKLFTCSEEGCTRAYKYEKNLRVHIKSYHMKEKSKRYKCTYPGCNKEVVKLKQHLRWHENPKGVKKVRAVRKDKGTIKRSTALQLAGLTTDYDVEKKIMKGENVLVEFNGEVIETCNELESVDELNEDSESEESEISVVYADYSDDESDKLYIVSDEEEVLRLETIKENNNKNISNIQNETPDCIETNNISTQPKILSHKQDNLSTPKEPFSNERDNSSTPLEMTGFKKNNIMLDDEQNICSILKDKTNSVLIGKEHNISSIPEDSTKDNDITNTIVKTTDIIQNDTSLCTQPVLNIKDLQPSLTPKTVVTKTFSIKSKIRAKMIFENPIKINETNSPIQTPTTPVTNVGLNQNVLDTSDRLGTIKTDENRFDNIFNYMLEKVQPESDESDELPKNLFGNNLKSCSNEIEKNDRKHILPTKVL